MKKFPNAAAVANDMGISENKLQSTLDAYNKSAEAKKCPFGKTTFENVPYNINEEYYVAIVTPLVHYCMAGVEVDKDGSVIGGAGPIPGLFAAGEVAGGVHGANRLGGNSLLDCVVFGRVCGANAAANVTRSLSQGSAGRLANIANQIGITIEQGDKKISISIPMDGSASVGAGAAAPTAAPAKSGPVTDPLDPRFDASAPAGAAGGAALKTYTAEEVAKHNTEKDCWVIVSGQVLDLTKFLPDHPGGRKAIMTFAGRDATEEFNMLHDPNVIPRYAADAIIGTLA